MISDNNKSLNAVTNDVVVSLPKPIVDFLYSFVRAQTFRFWKSGSQSFQPCWDRSKLQFLVVVCRTR